MRFLLVLLSLAILPFAPRGSAAQLSPGPLARAHAEFDGTLGCTKCHGGRRESTAARCLSCHKEIGWLATRNRGLHARDARGECASCHPDHAGRDFALVRWPQGSPERFDHADAGWALDGSHSELACDKCHTAKLRVSQAAALAPGGRAGAHWIGLERQCTSCHDDVHRGALTTAASRRQCTSCHDTREWSPAPKFDHASTRYALTGKHVRVKCDGCHLATHLKPPVDAAGKPVPVYRPVPFADCRSCHEDPHAGRFAGRCASCHSTSAFRDVKASGFDHDRTRYPLRGKHAAVDCAECHTGAGQRRTNPPFARCTSCHSDAHAGQLASRTDGGRCESCHRVTGWTPSSFGTREHASLRLVLDGAHALADCSSCHGPVRRGLPPLAGRPTLGSAGVVLRISDTGCASCHADPHGTTFATAGECTSCHDTRVFRPSSLGIDAHARYEFPLEGAHRAVPCAGCHRELARPPARSTLVRATPAVAPMTFSVAGGSTCSSCHEDPHRGEFTRRTDGGSCDGCHTVAAFVPASRFDHDRETSFPLTEGHAGVACGQCHRETRDTAGRLAVVYRISTACESCHASSSRSSRPSSPSARKRT